MPAKGAFYHTHGPDAADLLEQHEQQRYPSPKKKIKKKGVKKGLKSRRERKKSASHSSVSKSSVSTSTSLQQTLNSRRSKKVAQKSLPTTSTAQHRPERLPRPAATSGQNLQPSQQPSQQPQNLQPQQNLQPPPQQNLQPPQQPQQPCLNSPTGNPAAPTTNSWIVPTSWMPSPEQPPQHMQQMHQQQVLMKQMQLQQSTSMPQTVTPTTDPTFTNTVGYWMPSPEQQQHLLHSTSMPQADPPSANLTQSSSFNQYIDTSSNPNPISRSQTMDSRHLEEAMQRGKYFAKIEANEASSYRPPSPIPEVPSVIGSVADSSNTAAMSVVESEDQPLRFTTRVSDGSSYARDEQTQYTRDTRYTRGTRYTSDTRSELDTHYDSDTRYDSATDASSCSSRSFSLALGQRHGRSQRKGADSPSLGGISETLNDVGDALGKFGRVGQLAGFVLGAAEKITPGPVEDRTQKRQDSSSKRSTSFEDRTTQKREESSRKRGDGHFSQLAGFLRGAAEKMQPSASASDPPDTGVTLIEECTTPKWEEVSPETCEEARTTTASTANASTHQSENISADGPKVTSIQKSANSDPTHPDPPGLLSRGEDEEVEKMPPVTPKDQPDDAASDAAAEQNKEQVSSPAIPKEEKDSSLAAPQTDQPNNAAAATKNLPKKDGNTQAFKFSLGAKVSKDETNDEPQYKVNFDIGGYKPTLSIAESNIAQTIETVLGKEPAEVKKMRAQQTSGAARGQQPQNHFEALASDAADGAREATEGIHSILRSASAHLEPIKETNDAKKKEASNDFVSAYLPPEISNAMTEMTSPKSTSSTENRTLLEEVLSPQDQPEHGLTIKQRIIGCFGCMALGYLLSFGSVFRLNSLLVHGNPMPFVVTATVGNIVALCGSCFLTGPWAQTQKMFHKKRRNASFAYLSSLFLTIAVAFSQGMPGQKQFLLLLMICQYISIAVYCLSYVPFIDEIYEILSLRIKKLFKKKSDDDNEEDEDEEAMGFHSIV